MITVELAREKETKRTVRFAEKDEDGQVGIIYVPKPTLEALGNPKRLTLTLNAA